MRATERSVTGRSPLRYGAFVPQGWKLEYTGWAAAERVGAHEGARAARRAARLRPPLGVRPRRDGAAPRADALFEAFTMLAALAQHTTTIKLGQMVTCAAYRNAGPAREGSRVRRRVLRRPADPRASARAGTSASTRRTATSSRAAGTRLADPRRDARGDASGSGPRRPSRSRASTCAFDGAYCDPKPLQQLPADLGRRRRREGDAAHRGPARRRDQLAGRPRRRSCTSPRLLAAVLRRDRPRLRLDRAHARSRLPAVRHRGRPETWLDSPGGGSLWGGGDRTTSTCATTSSAPSSRSPRRCRRSSTRAAASSCSGSATSRRRRASRRSRATSCRTSEADRRPSRH